MVCETMRLLKRNGGWKKTILHRKDISRPRINFTGCWVFFLHFFYLYSVVILLWLYNYIIVLHQKIGTYDGKYLCIFTHAHTASFYKNMFYEINLIFLPWKIILSRQKWLYFLRVNPAGIYLLKVNNRITRTKLTIELLEQS